MSTTGGCWPASTGCVSRSRISADWIGSAEWQLHVCVAAIHLTACGIRYEPAPRQIIPAVAAGPKVYRRAELVETRAFENRECREFACAFERRPMSAARVALLEPAAAVVAEESTHDGRRIMVAGKYVELARGRLKVDGAFPLLAAVLRGSRTIARYVHTIDRHVVPGPDQLKRQIEIPPSFFVPGSTGERRKDLHTFVLGYQLVPGRAVQQIFLTLAALRISSDVGSDRRRVDQLQCDCNGQQQDSSGTTEAPRSQHDHARQDHVGGGPEETAGPAELRDQPAHGARNLETQDFRACDANRARHGKQSEAGEEQEQHEMALCAIDHGAARSEQVNCDQEQEPEPKVVVMVAPAGGEVAVSPGSNPLPPSGSHGASASSAFMGSP